MAEAGPADSLPKAAIPGQLSAGDVKALSQWHGWHAMRRGLASNVVTLGADPKIAQAILRHVNVPQLDFYIKARPEKTAATMANLEKAFKKGQEAFEKKTKAS
jgi:hypothetical protein